MADLAELELRIKSAQAELAERRLDKFDKSAKKAEVSAKRLGGASKKLGTATAVTAASTARLTTATGQLGASMAKLRGIVALVGVAIGGLALAVAARSMASFEKRLIGVGKTTDLAGAELRALGEDVANLSLRLPNTSLELLEIAKAAGQLGVTGTENLLAFTETVARLGASSDLAGEQAAIALARILNITGEAFSNVDRLGSVITELGNTMATTESQIAFFGQGVAAATAQFDISSADAVSLGAAMAQMGFQARVAATTMGRTLRVIDAISREGGVALRELATVAGLTGKELQTLFRDDPVIVFQKFLEGINRIKKEGGDVVAVLASFGLTGEQILKVLPTLAKGADKVAKAIAAGRDEFKANTALMIESERGAAALSAQWTLLGNAISKAFQQTVTDETSTIIVNLKSMTNTLAETIAILAGFEDAMKRIRPEAVALAAALQGITAVAATAVSLVLLRATFFAITGTLASLTTAIHKTERAFLILSLRQEGVSRSLIGLRSVMRQLFRLIARHPIGALATAVGAAAAAMVIFRSQTEEVRKSIEGLEGSAKTIADALARLGRARKVGDLSKQLGEMRQLLALNEKLAILLKQQEETGRRPPTREQLAELEVPGLPPLPEIPERTPKQIRTDQLRALAGHFIPLRANIVAAIKALDEAQAKTIDWSVALRLVDEHSASIRKKIKDLRKEIIDTNREQGEGTKGIIQSNEELIRLKADLKAAEEILSRASKVSNLRELEDVKAIVIARQKAGESSANEAESQQKKLNALLQELNIVKEILDEREGLVQQERVLARVRRLPTPTLRQIFLIEEEEKARGRGGDDAANLVRRKMALQDEFNVTRQIAELRQEISTEKQLVGLTDLERSIEVARIQADEAGGMFAKILRALGLRTRGDLVASLTKELLARQKLNEAIAQQKEFIKLLNRELDFEGATVGLSGRLKSIESAREAGGEVGAELQVQIEQIRLIDETLSSFLNLFSGGMQNAFATILRGGENLSEQLRSILGNFLIEIATNIFTRSVIDPIVDQFSQVFNEAFKLDALVLDTADAQQNQAAVTQQSAALTFATAVNVFAASVGASGSNLGGGLLAGLLAGTRAPDPFGGSEFIGSVHGNVFKGGDIFREPTFGRNSRGQGFNFGEDREEAVLPLFRDSRGDLGVRTESGGKSQKQITVNGPLVSIDASGATLEAIRGLRQSQSQIARSAKRGLEDAARR